MTGYVICATPRSGSTLLCALLRASRVAGWPESWFRRQDMAEYRADWGIGPDWPDYLAAALQAGRGLGGVAGVRMMWETFAEVGPQVLAAMGDARFVWLRRGDLVAQAVSRHRAEVSGTWHLGFEEADHPVEPAYDFDRIAGWLSEVETDNRAWQTWFASQGISPLIVEYETLSIEPIAVAERVSSYLDLRTAAPLAVTNHKMADQVSADWAARFRLQSG